MSAQLVYPFGVRHRRSRPSLWAARAQAALTAWRDRFVAPLGQEGDCAFVVGCGNSGTTLVASRLGTHPLVRLIPAETNLFEPRRPLARARARFLHETAAARAEGKALVVEKTPKHVHALARIRRLLPGARFVGLVRNPLDTCLSLKLRTKGRDWGGLDYAIERWLIDTGAVADLRGDPRALVLRYEDLTSAPERELRRLAAFLDLPWHRSMLDATNSAYASIRQRTATMRLRADQVRQPIRPNSGKWRSGLTPDEIATVRERTAALWARLGGGPDGASYLAEGPVNQG